MGLKERIYALKKEPGKGQLKHGPLLYNAGLGDAARVAEEAEDLMESMAEVLECVANGDDVSSLAVKVLGDYDSFKDKSENQ